MTVIFKIYDFGSLIIYVRIRFIGLNAEFNMKLFLGRPFWIIIYSTLWIKIEFQGDSQIVCNLQNMMIERQISYKAIQKQNRILVLVKILFTFLLYSLWMLLTYRFLWFFWCYQWRNFYIITKHQKLNLWEAEKENYFKYVKN